MILATNRNAVSFQVGSIPSGAGQDKLDTSNRVSTAAPNDTICWVAFIADTYIRRFANATEAAAVDVSASDGVNKGTFFAAGIGLPISVNRGEVLKIDNAGEVEYNYV